MLRREQRAPPDVGFYSGIGYPLCKGKWLNKRGAESVIGETNSRALTAGGNRVISYNIESTLLSAEAPFNGMDCAKWYKEDKSAAIPRVVCGILGCHDESTI